MTGWWVGCMRLLGGSMRCPSTTPRDAIACDWLYTIGMPEVMAIIAGRRQADSLNERVAR